MLQSINAFTCVFALINLLILFFVLKKILFKPVMSYMENRQNEVSSTLDHAEQEKTEALELKKQYEDQMKTAKQDGQAIIDEMTTRANKIYDDKIQEAQTESRTIISQAQEDAKREHEKVMSQSKSEIAGLALSAASKVMEANMDNEKNRELVDQFLKETGAA